MKHPKDLSVVYIITQLELGGAQKVCLNLLHGLEQEHIDAFLISSNQGILVNTVAGKPNVILLPSLQRAISLRALLQEWRSFKEIRKQLKALQQQNPDLIVHTHSTKAGIIGRWAAWAAGIKKRIHTVHGYAFHEHMAWHKWLAIYCVELCTSLITTHFVCVSTHDAKTGIRLFPRFSKKHSIIRAAVEEKQFYRPAERACPFPAPNEPFVFGTVACFKPQKNLFDLLSAFKSVHTHNPNTRLEIIGDGVLRPAIEAWIATHSLAHAITLHGWQENVASIMSNWHTFVLSSLWEGLPCAIVEARLLRLPVISYTTGGIPDIITHGANGLLSAQKNWQDLAHNMHAIARDQQLFTTLQTHCDDLRDFENNHMIQEHIKLYRQAK